MSFQVARCADLDEFKHAVVAIGQYFGLVASDESTSDRMERFSKNLPIERMHAAREDGRIVGGAGAFPFEMTVPGRTVPTAGVTVVGTYPTHRRRGVLRALMRAQLDDIHERGEPLAALFASEETIYGRFGYGMASFLGEITVPRESPFAIPLEPQGRLRLVEKDEALELFPQVWDVVRPQIPGMLARSRNWWEYRILYDTPENREGGGPKRLVVLERDGRPEGYAVYRHKPKWEHGVPDGDVEVIEAIALDGSPTAEIWRFLLDIDWAARATAWLVPIDHQLFHLLAHPRRMQFRIFDGLWVRLVDVGEALSARDYSADGAVVIEVKDDFCPWNEGRWKLADGEAKRSRATADLRCDVTELGSVYLGAFTFSELVRAGRVEELEPGAAARADPMVAWNRAPWCPEIF
jgi:predicted acetyltransferase